MYPIEKYQFKVYEKTNKDNSKSSVVVALSTYCGKVVKGVAKCMESDSFSLETGKKLAAARCDLKVCIKRKNRAMKKCMKLLSKLKNSSLSMTSYTNMLMTLLLSVGNQVSALMTLRRV